MAKKILMIKYIAVCLLSLGLLSFRLAENGYWQPTTGYQVHFSGGRLKGTFEGLKADILLEEANLQLAHINASIEPGTVSTGNWLLNKHVRAALSADAYPAIAFRSQAIVARSGGGYEAQGRLTIKDVTRPVTLPFTFTRQGARGVFEGTFKLKPRDYHVDRWGTPDEVTITLVVPVQQP
ncbi:MAG: YceI family protein [Chitinophagia bacterium]|nr:YceI family protein [Chitinophagia bacterium]